jgi:hypothetical protein
MRERDVLCVLWVLGHVHAGPACRDDEYTETETNSCKRDKLARFDEIGGDTGHGHLLSLMDTDRDGAVTAGEARTSGVRPEHFAYYDVEPDGQLGYEEFLKFSRERKLFRHADLTAPPPPGHLEPLGAHRLPNSSAAVDVVDYLAGETLEPARFWGTYVEGHRPLLLRGVGAGSVAQERWSREYLAEKFGHFDVKGPGPPGAVKCPQRFPV